MDTNDIVMGMAGDVMIGRGVNSIISNQGYGYPWGDVLPLLRSSDLNLVNLETTLTNSTKKVDKVFNFKATPDRTRTLLEANITVVNLANNHILDYSKEGLVETLDVLDKSLIRHVGAGTNIIQATAAVLTNVKDMQVAFVGFTDNEPGWKATWTKYGTNYIDVGNSASRDEALSTLRRLKLTSDHLIVSIHWGYNMQQEPSALFIKFAHDMIDNGASIIHGHSAHIFQAVEVYRRGIILYDTGDFVDDYAVDPVLRNDRSFYFKAVLGRDGIRALKLIPVLIDHYQVNLAHGEHFRWAIERMRQLSVKFGTEIDDDGVVQLSIQAKNILK